MCLRASWSDSCCRPTPYWRPLATQRQSRTTTPLDLYEQKQQIQTVSLYHEYDIMTIYCINIMNYVFFFRVNSSALILTWQGTLLVPTLRPVSFYISEFSIGLYTCHTVLLNLKFQILKACIKRRRPGLKYDDCQFFLYMPP